MSDKPDWPRTVRHRTFVNRAPQIVYTAVATADGLNSWFTTGAEVDSRAGGIILLSWKEFGAEKITATDRGTVLEAQPHSRFVFTWHPGPMETVVSIDMKPHAGGTLVEVEEAGFTESIEGAKTMLSVAVGWGEALTLLKFWLEANLRYEHVP